MYTENPSPDKRHHGPQPGILAIIYVLLLIGSLVLYGILSQGAPFPRPFGLLTEARQIYLQSPMAIRVNALLKMGSAIPLGLFTAALTSRLSFLGAKVTGVNIAFFGGIAASLLLSLSGICTWILSQPGIIGNDMTTMHALQLLSFGSGGIAFVVAQGLLLAGISVVSLFGGYAPRWLCWMGIILGVIAELAFLGFLVPQFYFLLPVVRFPAAAWMVGMGFTMTRGHRA